jgi:hypothetical protein
MRVLDGCVAPAGQIDADRSDALAYFTCPKQN